MKHRILYSAEFIDKILDGSKTITLRNPDKYKGVCVGDELEFVTEDGVVFATKVVKEVKVVCIIFFYEYDWIILDSSFNKLDTYSVYYNDGFDNYIDFNDYFITKTDSPTLKRTLIAF